MAAVDHDARVTCVHGGDAAIEAVAVVEVHGNRNTCCLRRSARHGGEVVEACVLHGAGRGLHDHRAATLLSGTDDGHDELEVLNIEGSDGVMVRLGIEQHVLGGDEHRNRILSV